MKNVIYYFSGTGNSMRAAEKIALKLHDTNIISMRCKASEVPALDAEVVGLIFPVYEWTLSKTEKMLEKIAEDIDCRAVNKYKEPNFLVKLLFPVLMPKRIENLHELDKYFHTTQECISCGMCAKVCPCNNIEMKDNMPTFKHKCNQCMSCISYCPKEALNFKNFTQKRKKYHNPYISSKDISLDKRYIE